MSAPPPAKYNEKRREEAEERGGKGFHRCADEDNERQNCHLCMFAADLRDIFFRFLI